MQLSNDALAVVRMTAKNVIAKMDSSLDVPLDVTMLLEDLYETAFTSGVKTGVESVHTGKFDAAVHALAMEKS